MDPGNRFDQRRLILRARDAIEFRLQRLQSLGFDRFFVYAGTVVVADLLGDAIASRILSRRFLQDFPHDGCIFLTDFDKARP